MPHPRTVLLAVLLFVSGAASAQIDLGYALVDERADLITHRADFAGVLIDWERHDEARAQLDVASSLPVDTPADRDAAAKADALRARLP